MITIVVLVGVGVGFYGVQIIWANVPALVLTFGLGIACFCAVGLAIAALAPTPSSAQAISNGGLILLSFISGVFGFTELPTWMERVAAFFPLTHFVDPVAAGFNPYVDASTPAWGDLGMMAAWGIAAALVVRSAFGWDPTQGRRTKPGPAAAPGAESAPAAEPAGARLVGAATAPAVISTGTPSLPTMIAAQTRYAALQILRDPASLFFAIVFPVLLVTFFTLIYGSDAEWGGLPLPQYVAAAFAVYGVATMSFVNLPGAISEQRGNRVLKRIHGTPLPSWCYLAARILAALVLGVATVVLVFAVAVAFLSVNLPPSTWAATLLTFTLATVCFAACGLALVAIVDGPQAVIAVGLCVLLPLSFISDIFISTPSLPTVLNAVGWTFPLRHAVHAAVTATSGGALDGAFWLNLAVLLLWTAIGLLAAWRLFHWEPRVARSRRAAHTR
jgi:ABC-type multidrug transport system permease subunit